MTVFDYAVLGIIAASLLLGMWRGVMSEILALAAWVVAFLIGRLYAADVAPVYDKLLPDPLLRYLAGFATVAVTVLLLFSIGRLVVRLLMKAVGLGWADRSLGAVFGIGRGVVVALLLVLVGGLTPLPKEAWWRDATLAPPLETAVIAVKPWLPADLAKRIRYR